jgi:hypothetical protein
MALKRCLRVITYFLSVSLSATYLKVKSIYRLWLRCDLISNSLLLKLNKSTNTEFLSEGSSDTLSVAKMELLYRMKGLIGKELQVYKTVICNVCIC